MILDSQILTIQNNLLSASVNGVLSDSFTPVFIPNQDSYLVGVQWSGQLNWSDGAKTFISSPSYANFNFTGSVSILSNQFSASISNGVPPLIPYISFNPQSISQVFFPKGCYKVTSGNTYPVICRSFFDSNSPTAVFNTASSIIQYSFFFSY